MSDEPNPQEPTPRRHGSEYEDNHYHDEDEVAQPATDDAPRRPSRMPPPRSRKLPPPPRRFHED